MAHPLHEVIAELLKEAVPAPATLIIDQAGKGDQRIPLFVKDTVGREHWLCCVDGLVKVDGHVRLLVEIDESNVKPTHLAGKYLTSALANFYIHKRERGPLPKFERVWFLQIVSSKGLEPNSKKPAQWQTLEAAIRSIPCLGNIHRYGLFAGLKSDFIPGGNQHSQVIEFVREAINDGEPANVEEMRLSVS